MKTWQVTWPIPCKTYSGKRACKFAKCGAWKNVIHLHFLLYFIWTKYEVIWPAKCINLNFSEDNLSTAPNTMARSTEYKFLEPPDYIESYKLRVCSGFHCLSVSLILSTVFRENTASHMERVKMATVWNRWICRLWGSDVTIYHFQSSECEHRCMSNSTTQTLESRIHAHLASRYLI